MLLQASQMALVVKKILQPMQEMKETQVQSLGWEDPLVLTSCQYLNWFQNYPGQLKLFIGFLWTPIGASQVVLVVKNLPAYAGDIRDAGWSLGQEDPLEEDMAIHSSILAWLIPMDRGTGRATVHKVPKNLDTIEAT